MKVRATMQAGEPEGPDYLDVHRGSKTVVASERLKNLTPGETIIALAEAEVTNDLEYPVMVGAQLVLATRRDAVNGYALTRATAFNITPEMHHGVIVKAGALMNDEASRARYVNLVLYSAASAAGRGAKITVERENGHLAVVRLAP